jgi:ABC-type transporter Mla subunit MlaD
VRADAKTDLKVGLTVLLGVVLLLFGIGWAKKWNPFAGPQHLLHAKFPSAGGIEKNDPVFIRGIKHGTVSVINSPPGKDVEITMDIDQPILLHKDAKATIMMLELMSGKKVDIEDGIASDTFDLTKDTLQGYAPGDISTLVALLSSLSGSLPPITRNLDTVLASLNGFFEHDKLKDKVYSAMDEAQKTLKSLQAVLTENRSALKRTIDQADVLTRELNSTVVSIRPDAMLLIDSLRHFVQRAGNTLTGADSLLGSLNTMMAGSKDKTSFLYRITNDQAFGSRLDSLIISAQKFLEQARLQGIDANIRFFNSSKPVK